MKKLVALLLVSMMATVAFAGLDPDNDSIGVYFDTLGDTNTTTGITATTKNVYVILMNSTFDLKGFEFAYRIESRDPIQNATLGDDLVRIANIVQGTSFVDIGVSTDPLAGDYRCGYATARPMAPAIVLVNWRFRYYGDTAAGDPDRGMDFYITGCLTNPSLGSLYPVVDNGDVLRKCGISSGDLGVPCASTVNSGPVAVENSSFGSVKSLFR